jgi:MFS family permease
MKYLRFHIFIFCTACAGSSVVMFLSPYLKSRGMSDGEVGGLLSTYHIMMPLVMLAFGLMADRVSCRLLVVLGSVMSVLYCSLMPHTENIYLISILMILGGIGGSMCFVTGYILFLKSLDKAQRGRHLSIFVACTTTGYALGTMISSILIYDFDLPLAAIFHISMPLYFTSFLAATRLPEAPIERFPLIKYFHDLNRPPVFCVVLLSFTMGMHFGSESFAMVRFMTDSIAASGKQMAVYFVFMGITMATFSRIAGHVMDTQGRIARILVLAMTVSGLFHIATYWSNTFPQFLLTRLIHTSADGVLIFSMPMLVRLVFSSGRMGGNYGFSRTINSIGVALGTAISGFLVARFSLGIPFVAAGLFQICSAGVLWSLRGRLPLMQTESARLSLAAAD